MNRRRTVASLIIGLATVSAAWLTLRHAVSGFIAKHFGARLLAMADGKFTDARKFADLRLRDAALLAAAICVLGLAHVVIVGIINRRAAPRWHWIAGSASAFVCFNAWAAVAMRTALFWCALFSGKHSSDNYTQYQIKLTLMQESDAPEQAVLIGNSQTHAEINVMALNERLGKKLWTTELHFPGSHPYECCIQFTKLPAVNLKYAICYVSEIFLYGGIDSPSLMFFQRWKDLPEYYRLGGGQFRWTQNMCYGLLGDTIPLFRLREPIAARLLGFSFINIGQTRYDKALEANLEQRAAEAAKGYRAGPETEFEERSLVALADACGMRNCKLVLCMGQPNPLLRRALPPSLRIQMVSFLRDLAKRNSSVILLDESEMPSQLPEDYDDLTHVNEKAQTRFSEYIAGVLDRLMAGKAAGGEPPNRTAETR